jgi:hypothetical protein
MLATVQLKHSNILPRISLRGTIIEYETFVDSEKINAKTFNLLAFQLIWQKKNTKYPIKKVLIRKQTNRDDFYRT